MEEEVEVEVSEEEEGVVVLEVSGKKTLNDWISRSGNVYQLLFLFASKYIENTVVFFALA